MFSTEAENRLKAKAIELLERGRPDWDIIHTLAAVFWMKKLLEEERGNDRILIPAIYLHDVGYSQAYTASDYDSVQKAKEGHMEKGAAIAQEVLEDFDLSLEEKKEIIHLVRVHDDLERISSPNEILVFEADSLSHIDIERVKSNFSKKDIVRFIANYEKKRASRFKTKSGKKFLSILLPKAKKFYGLA